jgi:hypothetical protein
LLGAIIAQMLMAVASLLRAQQALTGNLWGVPLDDAYIHFRFAENLAHGYGFSFNPGHPVAGSTAPLWTVLLAFPALLGIPLWLAAKAIGIAALGASAVLAWRLALRCTDEPLTALAAGALTAIDGRLLWAAPAGMEVTLFTALSLGAFLVRPSAGATVRERNLSMLLLALLCGLASSVRPEGYLLTTILFVDMLARRRASLKIWAMAGVLYLAMLVPYALFCLTTTGHPLPTTFYAKTNPGTSLHDAKLGLAFLVAVAEFLYRTNPLILFLAPVGGLSLLIGRAEARAVVLWPALLLAEQSLVSPYDVYHYARYVIPLDPAIMICAVAGVSWLHRRVGWQQTRHLSLILVLAASLLLLPRWSAAFASDVRDINTMQIGMAHWVETHVPAGQPVAVNDIGAVGYIANHPVVDVMGLVSPDLLRIDRELPYDRRLRDLYAAIRRSPARDLIIFPSWFPAIAGQPGLRPRYSITIPGSYIEGGPSMVVYRLPRS